MRIAVVGAGHNGLVAAARLAGEGHAVTVAEAREIVGGAAVTEELIPGFRVSTASYSFSLFRPHIARALELERHGLRLDPKEPRMFVPLLDGRHFYVWRDRARTLASIRAIDERDADAYPRWDAFWEEVATIVRPLIDGDPPTLAALEDALDRRGKADLFRLAIAGSAADTVEHFFHSDEVRGAFVGQGIIGTYAGPRTPGTAWVMTYHAFAGELVDGPGTWAYVRGGMGGLTQALASCARERDVTILTEAPVERIDVEQRRARGVVLVDGTRIDADVVLANTDPKRTYLTLVDPDALPDAFVEQVRSLDATGSVVKVNLALDGVPEFTAAPGREPGPQHAGTVEISPTIDALEEAFADAREGRVSRRPFMEVFMQSVTDPTLAPPGKHVASCFAQYAPGSVPMEQWQDMREAAGDAVVDVLDSYAPGIRDLILHREVLGPADLEHRFGLTGGNIFHGEIRPGNILGERLDVRSPIQGLYLCGSGAHPGGGVSGAPGWRAAEAVLQDLAD